MTSARALPSSTARRLRRLCAGAAIAALSLALALAAPACTSGQATSGKRSTTTLPLNVTVDTGPRTAGPDDALIAGFPEFGRPAVFRVQSSGTAACSDPRCTDGQTAWDAVLLVPQSTRDLASFLMAATTSAGWTLVAKPGADGSGVLIATRKSDRGEERLVARIQDASIAGNTRESSRVNLQIVTPAPPPTTTVPPPPPPPPTTAPPPAPPAS